MDYKTNNIIEINSQMELQLFIGKNKPEKKLFKPIKNKNFIKPAGGLWTSPYKDNASAWVEWCISSEFREPYNEKWFVLKPKNNPKIITIDNCNDLYNLYSTYSLNHSPPSDLFNFLDFEKIAKNHDGIYLTENGEQETRFSHPLSLYGWDCESILWLKWCFESIEEIEKLISDEQIS